LLTAATTISALVHSASSVSSMSPPRSGADGTTVELSGIDPIYKNECLTDIQVGRPAMIWFGLFANGVILGEPSLVFSGTVDKPTLQIGGDTVTKHAAIRVCGPAYSLPGRHRLRLG
jgi:hypothetical protein